MNKTVQKTETRRETLYRVVVAFTYANGPFNVASRPMVRLLALDLWERHVRSNSFRPHTNARVRVLSVAECERWGYR